MKKRSSSSTEPSHKKSSSQSLIPRKDSKSSEFDQLLKSGETILLSLNPHEKTLQKTIPEDDDDGLDKIISAVQGGKKDFEGQRATLSSKPSLPAGTESILASENKRLESRIQQLTSDLFKERAANAELSDQVKGLLFQLEQIKRRSLHLENQSDSTLEESPEAVLESIEKVELKEMPTPSSSIDLRAPSPSGNSDEAWATKYAELEQKCNLLAKRAVQTIQETKIELLELQQDNLELQDRIRELQEDLQKRDDEKAKSMSLIPRLIEVIRKLQTELAEEKQKRDLESEFDALQLQVTRQA